MEYPYSLLEWWAEAHSSQPAEIHQIVEAYRNSLRQQGFGPEELEVCRALNLTAAEIEEMRAEILSGRELEGAASLYESTRELARALREFSRLLVALPVF